MLALVDGVPRTLPRRRVHPALGRPPDRGHRAAHAVPPAQGRGRRPHPARLLKALDALDEVIALIRALADRRGGPRRPDRAARDRRDPGAARSSTCSCAGWPPSSARRSSTTTTELERDDRRLQGHPGQARAPAHDRLRGAGRDRRQVRRRPAHPDRALRRRHVDGGPHPRGGRGRHDHPRRLRQAHPGRRLPHAAARRQGRARRRSCAATTSSSTSSPRRRTTGCCSSPTWAGSTAPRPTSCRRPAATPRASTSPTCSRSSPTSRSPRCSTSATTSAARTSCSPPATAWSRRPG